MNASASSRISALTEISMFTEGEDIPLAEVFTKMYEYTKGADIDPESLNKTEAGEGSERKSILAYPYLILGALAMFCHVGSQVISVDTSIRYAESMGWSLDEAKILPSMISGLFLIAPRRLSAGRLGSADTILSLSPQVYPLSVERLI